MLKKLRYALAIAGLGCGFGYPLFGGTLSEDFASDPTASGWKIFGDASLFTWNASEGNLRVTWDSSRPNSYFYRPLATVLARDDDFTIQFELRLTDIATNLKSGPFEIAIGLLNFSDATRADFQRGTGINEVHGPRNIVEFDYFPAGYYPGWGSVDPSVSPTLISKDNGFALGFKLLELTNDALYKITMEFNASTQTLHTRLLCNGQEVGPVDDVIPGETFTDFRVDTIAIASYSDAGADYDSVLAHGAVDNLSVTIPPPPVSSLSGQLDAGVWQVQFLGRSNWLYALERTTDLTNWTQASSTAESITGTLYLADTNPPAGSAFYRVRAERP